MPEIFDGPEMRRIDEAFEGLRKNIEKELQMHEMKIQAMHMAFSLFAGAMLESKAVDRARLDQVFSAVTEGYKNDPTRGTENHRYAVCTFMNSYLTWLDQEAGSPQKTPMPFYIVQGGKVDGAQPESDAPEEKKE